MKLILAFILVVISTQLITPLKAQEAQMPVERTGSIKRLHFSAGLRSSLRYLIVEHPSILEFSIGPEIALTIIDKDPYTLGNYIQIRAALQIVSGSSLESQVTPGTWPTHYGFSATRLSMGIANVFRGSPTSLGWYYSLSVDMNLTGRVQVPTYTYSGPVSVGYDLDLFSGLDVSLGFAQTFPFGSSKILCLLGPTFGVVSLSELVHDVPGVSVGITLGATYIF
ncbi:MAG: hypothetical protein H7X70_04945 [Candidatus Kapabacteria bacterium]|nr:hypothetical protein [Candidatus Kapabacteria bacterium]